MTGRYIIVGLGAATAIAVGTYLFKLNRLSAEIDVVVTVKVHNVSFKGVDLRVDVTLKNPTSGTVTVKHPFLKLMYGQSTIASSTVKDIDKILPPYGEVILDPIMINIGLISLASSAPSVLTAVRAGKAIDAIIEVQTTINNTVQFKKAYNIQLGGGKSA